MPTSLAQGRAQFAAAVESVSPDLNIRTRTIRSPKPNDGWITVGAVRPGFSYTGSAVTMTAVVLLSAEEARADDRFEALAVPLVNAVSRGPMTNTSDLVCEPGVVLVGDPPVPMYAALLTATLEVD